MRLDGKRRVRALGRAVRQHGPRVALVGAGFGVAGLVGAVAPAGALPLGPDGAASAPGQGARAIQAGPLAPNSPAGKVAVEDAIAQVTSREGKLAKGQALPTLDARAVEADTLGMVHVRLVQEYDGIPVFGEELVTHQTAAGKMKPLTGEVAPASTSLDRSRFEISPKRALATARASFGLEPAEVPSVEKVFVREGGVLTPAYHVTLVNLQDGPQPLRMSYLVDAQEDRVLQSWNAIDSQAPGQAAGPMTVAKTLRPQVKIEGSEPVTQTIAVAEQLGVEQASLSLDVRHPNIGDLHIALKSPSGTTQVLHDQTGGAEDDLQHTYSLTEFGGELSDGDWTLSIQDKQGEAEGSLESAELSLTGHPPIEVVKAASPKEPIPDADRERAGVYEQVFEVEANAQVAKATVEVDVDHPFRGDLRVSLVSPSGKTEVLKPNSLKDDAQGLKKTFEASAFSGERTSGPWKVRFEDTTPKDTGLVRDVKLRLVGPVSQQREVTETVAPHRTYGDNQTVWSQLEFKEDLSVGDAELLLDLRHEDLSDLLVVLTGPNGEEIPIHSFGEELSKSIDITPYVRAHPAKGTWELMVSDWWGGGGTLESWGIRVLEQPPPPPPRPSAPPGPRDDATLYSGEVAIEAAQQPGGEHVLVDETRGYGLETRDAGSSGPDGPQPFVDGNNVWGETTDGQSVTPALDTHYGLQSTYDFFKEILGRDSIDGAGEKLIANVEGPLGENAGNAYWDGLEMTVGGGTGGYSGPMGALDVVGHEAAHGLTQRTAGLIYAGQPGCNNEAWSDILGTGVEWFAAKKNHQVVADWKMAEDIYPKGSGKDAMRYLNDPMADGYSIDHKSLLSQNGEVHGCSGIVNNAFYLLVEGGTNRTSGLEVKDGIGMEKGLKIFGRAVIHYMQPTTDLAGAREATVRAAADLYGGESVEVTKVQEAFTAVGVEPAK